ncbi:MAG TPA: T9SS type A sorting domain-containing protein, partial [Saprospiraceae bacterium]|nr:T9SS type A sorting domain-containing protein [Saprospiraceae bacterium]
NWFFQFFGTFSDYWYNSLCFINENTGWVAGYNTIMFGTTDGGDNWDTLSLVNGICVDFINSQTGWTGSENGKIFKTTNGGYNWYEQTYPAVGGFVTDIFFANDSVGYSTSVFQILKTTNSGGAFVSITNNSNEVPREFSLKQNYPNPFNSETTIEFQIMSEAKVRLEIFNSIGQLTEIIIEQNLKTGYYRSNWNATNYPSGIYFYRLTANNYIETKKAILNK